MKIWAHTLVRNEERYVWFSVMSVIEHVDRILVWDTGSEDKTVEIVKKITKLYPQKVDFREVGKVTVEEFPEIRQKMLDETKSDWILLVDGDEVWWDATIRNVVGVINNKGSFLEVIVNRYFNLVGDVFHYQEESAGMYEIGKIEGHLNIRATNTKIPGLHTAGPHGRQAYFDDKGTPIQDRSAKRRFYIKEPAYLHFTHLRRSNSYNSLVPKRGLKLKYELGRSFPLDFYYPEVFFRARPTIIPSPWEKMSSNFYIKALVQTPLRRLKRKLVRSKSGY